jgi:broad specificity phosphatase PhoE
MLRALDLDWMPSVARVFCSAEQKARDGAQIIHDQFGVPMTVVPDLGENDRSATGFLAPEEFWPVVEDFFANPTLSIRGWERAVDAQTRVVRAVEAALESDSLEGPVVFVAHGGVGCLLLCHLKGVPISRAEEQPSAPSGSAPGVGGGYYFAFDRITMALASDWARIDESN